MNLIDYGIAVHDVGTTLISLSNITEILLNVDVKNLYLELPKYVEAYEEKVKKLKQVQPPEAFKDEHNCLIEGLDGIVDAFYYIFLGIDSENNILEEEIFANGLLMINEQEEILLNTTKGMLNKLIFYAL
ncbi:hypothetical protein J0818_29560 [Bacillus cereus]|uniref:Uncharacterized protein n=1 Tax=Bacillus mobilis TaxID=2026190 RepID=A0A1Y6A027_9BACI|nr:MULTISPECIES: hypothetical protein [Bacillus cereus group]MBL3741308.1 hypothetical protein [Bacillus cereus]MBL3864132.1 hypothetical protein [Bacillus cereus]SME17108.1 hypothetical protein BACERE00185_03156 [Bacillus mobilis]HDR6770132.1 hypothetical protein [Bacillus cereus]